jgi:hypothetical protein
MRLQEEQTGKAPLQEVPSAGLPHVLVAATGAKALAEACKATF